MQTYGVPAAWLHRVQCQALLRALFRALFRDAESCTYMPELQCRYRTSLTRLIFGGATIFKEGDDTAGFATTLPANNYRTGSAGTKHCEMHSPIWKAGSGKCTWRRSDNCTPRTAKNAPREVMANVPTDESRSRMRKSQSRMRSRLSLGDPDSVSTIATYTAATGKRLQNQS